MKPIYSTAMHSISTSVFRGRVLTATHLQSIKHVSKSNHKCKDTQMRAQA